MLSSISLSKQVKLHIPAYVKSGVSGYVTFFGQYIWSQPVDTLGTQGMLH